MLCYGLAVTCIEVGFDQAQYVGGDSKLVRVDVDHISYFELVDYAMESGFYSSRKFHIYGLDADDGGLHHFESDKDVLHLAGKVMTWSEPFMEVLIQPGPILADEAYSCSRPTNPSPRPNEQKAQSTKPARSTDRVLVDIDNEYGHDSDDSEYKQSVGSGESDDDTDIDDLVPSSDHDEEEVLEEVNGSESDREDLEWRQSQDAVRKATHVDYGDILTPGESEDDNIRGKKYKEAAPSITEHTNWKKFIWKVGTRFASRDAFKEAVRRYSVTIGRNLYLAKSETGNCGRIVVKCIEGCPFFLLCSLHKGKECYMVKRVQNKHSCQRNMIKNRQLTTRFIANEFLPLFRSKPNWSTKEIVLAVKQKYKVIITKWLAYKAKSCAHKKLHGPMRDHYSKIGAYMDILKKTNPTSTFVLVTAPPGFINLDPTTTCETFFRLFVCFDGFKKGFLAGCRKVLCLDGCFLKTFLGGMLLTAVGSDANDQMYPLAWAVVEGENNDSWEWLMEELRKCLGINDGGEAWTFISDQQKGLLNAVALIWPRAEHRNCARHIYANWHKTFKDEELKELYWKATRAYCEPKCIQALDEMRSINPDAIEALLKQDKTCFNRCYLKTHTKCDVIVNNMAETFNEMAAKDVVICPNIQEKLEFSKGAAYRCEVYPSSYQVFQVRDFDDVSVDLDKRTCTCRKWELRGYPCKHVCAVAGFLHKNAEDYVDQCYHKDTYMKIYDFTIPPLPSEKYWPKVDYPMDPPPIKVAPGRPKKNRKRDPHEDPKKPGKLTKHGVIMTCGICGARGHNKRKCAEKGKMNTAEPRSKRQKGNIRKRKSTQQST
ncbi:uncharacterized protein LOC110887548 [Helianthus annuus]|uniref:uncharacterized protein LOC110887548 n=1 Tax=Helianthus annuus TaxID=4232 RepID=UPI000B8F7169|nr:uncharacterized protein LOC110887548 [Helianthus annuus]